jgi:hypothetical protein
MNQEICGTIRFMEVVRHPNLKIEGDFEIL